MSKNPKAQKAVELAVTELDRAAGGMVFLNPGDAGYRTPGKATDLNPSDAGDRPNELIFWPSEEVDNV